MSKEIERRVFLDELPKWSEGGKAKEGTINWDSSIGHKIKFIYDNEEGEFEIINYDGKNLYLKYLGKDILKIYRGSLQQCKLKKILGKKADRFKVKIGTHFKDDKRDLTIVDREYRQILRKDGGKENKRWYKYKCNKCGWEEGWIVENSLLRGSGCMCCCANPKIVIPGINDIPTTDPWMIPYFQGGYDEAKLYTKSSSQKILPICPDCGRVKKKTLAITDINNKHSIGCSCGDGYSYPNKFMFNVLEQLIDEFKPEYSPEWCKYEYKGKTKQGIYDFYFELDNKQYIVEMDGGFHYKYNTRNEQTEEETKKIDNLKDLKAKEQDISVIRIECKKSDLEHIKNNILMSELRNIFDLKSVDWNKVEEFALSNLVKKCCEYKNNNSNLTTTDIGKLVGITSSTVKNYLKKGTKLGWCEYNASEETIKSLNKGRETQKKKIAILKDKKVLGIFESAAKLIEESEKIFGVKLRSSGISKVCNNKINIYKGYHFKYVE